MLQQIRRYAKQNRRELRKPVWQYHFLNSPADRLYIRFFLRRIIGLACFLFFIHSVPAQTYTKGKLLYTNPLSTPADTAGWKMDGAGQLSFSGGWMEMSSPKAKGHHVFWCPQDFPDQFMAEWQVQNRHTKRGLCIVFFAATGLNGEDIFAPSLSQRDGTFGQYTKGDLHNYHISYYANSPDQPGREIAHLRKNKGFYKVQTGEAGIPVDSKNIHTIQLIKDRGRIILHVDGRKVIDWTDDGIELGKILQEGKIGFRQMKWTQFAYRNFSVWECISQPAGDTPR